MFCSSIFNNLHLGAQERWIYTGPGKIIKNSPKSFTQKGILDKLIERVKNINPKNGEKYTKILGIAIGILFVNLQTKTKFLQANLKLITEIKNKITNL